MFLRAKKFSQLASRELLEMYLERRQQFGSWFQDLDPSDPKIQGLLDSGSVHIPHHTVVFCFCFVVVVVVVVAVFVFVFVFVFVAAAAAAAAAVAAVAVAGAVVLVVVVVVVVIIII